MVSLWEREQRAARKLQNKKPQKDALSKEAKVEK